ncbi:MAG: DUF3467 domain-containing protein [Candidatus Berkelbacteria bacterium]|nr:DUF3467 domain-containing protein [Candidatus Berkelbacteria bacterium]
MDQPKQLSIKATDEDLKGRYANAMQVSHTPEEFIFDFLNMTPPAGQLISRIITNPGHAKRILSALQDNIAKYEAKFGKIQESKQPKIEINLGKPS